MDLESLGVENHRQSGNLLSKTNPVAIVLLGDPVERTGMAVATSRTGVGSSLGRGGEIVNDFIGKTRVDFGSQTQKIGIDTLEGSLIVVASDGVLLAGNFKHDLVIEEDILSRAPEVSSSSVPVVVASSSKKIGSTRLEHTGVVTPQEMGDLRTVVNIKAIVDSVGVMLNESRVPQPLPGSLGPLQVDLLSGVVVETSSEREDCTVGDRVLVVVTVIGRENLPSDTTATVQVPSANHCSKGVLGHVKPSVSVIGLGNPRSAAAIMVSAQTPWSSLPSEVEKFATIRSYFSPR